MRDLPPHSNDPATPARRAFWRLVAGAGLAAALPAWADPDVVPVPEPDLPLPLPEPELLPPPPLVWRSIVIHHSASRSGNAASFSRLHRAKGWDALAYHFVITNGCGGRDGGLEVGPRWWQQKHGAHAGHLHNNDPDLRNVHNEFGIGICLVGNFEHTTPTQAQLQSLSDLLRRLTGRHGIAPESIVGHRHVTGTACPGRRFPWAELFRKLDFPRPTHLARLAASGTYERCPWCQGESHGESQSVSSASSNPPRP